MYFQPSSRYCVSLWFIVILQFIWVNSHFTMIPKDLSHRNRLYSEYRVPTTDMEVKSTNDQWTLEAIYPRNGSLYSPIIGPDGYLYVCRLNVDHVFNERETGYKQWYNGTYSLQIFKLSTLSFDIVWYQSLAINAPYYERIGPGYYRKISVQDITYFSDMESHKEYIIVDAANKLFILDPITANILNEIDINSEHMGMGSINWWIDQSFIRVLQQNYSQWYGTGRYYITTYDMEGIQMSQHYITSDEDRASWTWNAADVISFDEQILFQTNTNGSLCAKRESENGFDMLWTNTDFVCLKTMVNDVLKRVYCLGYKSEEPTEDAIFLYSVDFEGELKNRFIISDEFEVERLGDDLIYRYQYVTSQFALSYDGQHLYLLMSNGYAWRYLMHFEFDGDTVVSTKTISLNENNKLLLEFLRMVIDEDNTLFVWLLDDDEYTESIYVAYDEDLNKLWSKTQKHWDLHPVVHWPDYSHHSFTGFGLSDYHWYVIDKFYQDPEDIDAGYFKITVYGPVNTQHNVIYEWKFWTALIVFVLTFILGILVHIYSKNSHLKRMVEHTTTGKEDGDTEKVVRLRRIKILVKSVGLIILSALVTLNHFDKINAIQSFLDIIGSYDNVRNTYLQNAQLSSNNDSYISEDLCFCADTTLDIESAQCNADHCYKTEHECSTIIQYLGECDLTWYQYQCECDLVLDGCNTTMSHNTTVASTLPERLYKECTNSYHTLYMVLWIIWGIHIGFAFIYMASAVVTRGKTSKIGWITRTSSAVTLILLMVVSATVTDDICTGADTLLGYRYPGCKYIYPKEFDQSFAALESNAYANVVSIVVLYGMETALKFVDWIPLSCTSEDFCLRN
eukprot:77314_1